MSPPFAICNVLPVRHQLPINMLRPFKTMSSMRRLVTCLIFWLGLLTSFSELVKAQDTVTGAFEGTVSNNVTGEVVAGAPVQITNELTGITYNLATDSKGRFFQGLLSPGIYLIRVSVPGFRPRILRRLLKIAFTGEVIPVPVTLDPENTALPPPSQVPEEAEDIRVEMNTSDARRDGSYPERTISELPLGSTSLNRSFDELALLLPGVAPPPQTIGDVSGPGIGPGVGSAGQFSVNGLRSRANNFTVDGSDNNDEDIGVRRQGFVALIPQPIESIQEYQAITLLAPAQFGRNIGAQVNAVSKSGGNQIHGSIYGSLSSSLLNSRDFFDTDGQNRTFPLLTSSGQPVLFNGQPITSSFQSGRKDSFTFAQVGATFSGPLIRDQSFYFLSFERPLINATKEKSFVVPTIEERGIFRTGATGLFIDPFDSSAIVSIPSTLQGSALFSLIPYPNNPTGNYDQHTFTQELPASGKGVILSGRLDDNFVWNGRNQSVTGRYNFTNDLKFIPAVSEAIFSTLLSRIQTHNFSFFLNSLLSGSPSTSSLSNQIRFSFGRTRLKFSEVRDNEFLIPSGAFPGNPFLLNAPLRLNITTPPAPGMPNTGAVQMVGVFDPVGGTATSTVEELLGPIGQVIIAGFSPLGVDVYNFPQQRVNNTFQLADEMTWQIGNHTFVFGTDNRRTDLISDLPRLARPLVTFNGTPRLIPRTGTCVNGGIGNFCFPTNATPNAVIRPEDLVSLGAASNFLLTFNVSRQGGKVNLRYFQLNFYGQDTWHIRPQLSLSYGLRYEYNTPVKEVDSLIESTFNDPRLAFSPGIISFVAGRNRLYDSDKNNFAPRLGIAYSPNLFGAHHTSVFRGGYGLFFDQIIGAVVSQSRNVFPTYLTTNFGGVNATGVNFLAYLNPSSQQISTGAGSVPLSQPGTLNTLNPALSFVDLFSFLNTFFPNAITATLPARNLRMPMAHHYSLIYEQQLNSNYLLTVSYVGTSGRNLLRFSTPNLGSSLTIAPTDLQIFPVPTTTAGSVPFPLSQGVLYDPNRPIPGVGSVNQFESTARSAYNSIQVQLVGRFSNLLNFQVAYVYGKVLDDVSDVFDMAGAYVLPQNSQTFTGEWAPANFDVRHRISYSVVYGFRKTNRRHNWLTNNLQVTSTGRFHTGQPFTVNSIIDVNLDGNLTDRLNSTAGIQVTGNGSQPLVLTASNPFTLLAPFGQDGQISRNSFRAGNVLELDLSFIKQIKIGETRRLVFRADVFNFINRVNFGVPVRLLEAPGFGRSVETVTPPRRVQFSLKFEF
jgi:hypothetical protein